jgi:sugar transferase EpsL
LIKGRGAFASKRLVDFVGASAGIIVLSPLLCWTALAILVLDGRPIFFRQVRPGMHGKPFRILKFRTMRPPKSGEIWYETDDRRVTILGRFLRSTSLDELPELWNVVLGEMSLVGPRPLLVEYMDRYTAEERRRHNMRPGITGLAAVRGRHTLPFTHRLRLDTWYVEHWSLRLDAQIAISTIRQVLRHTDVVSTQDMESERKRY